MSETIATVAITTVGGLLTLVFSRIRFICRPCSEVPERRFQSGCTDAHLDSPSDEIVIAEKLEW